MVSSSSNFRNGKYSLDIKLERGVSVILVANLLEFEYTCRKNFHFILRGKPAKRQKEYVNVDMLTIHFKCEVSIPFSKFKNAL